MLAVLEVMGATKTEGDHVTSETVANAAVRSVDFVTSAVSMATLPSSKSGPHSGTGRLAEVAFIGRSNVGKSSLVNMVCNRRALAYTSKTPGKTQQFNYFVVNNQSKWDPAGTFHLVDLPGLGYAKVPKVVREAWVAFMSQYFYEREVSRSRCRHRRRRS